MKTTPKKTFMIDRDSSTVIVPAGRYYVCDPCYAVREEGWMSWLEAADYTANDLEGILYGLTEDGFPVLGFETAHGDGCWTGNDGFRYSADAGMIGLVPVDHNPDLETADSHEQLYPLVNIITFDRPTRCHRTDNGILTFGKVRINTNR